MILDNNNNYETNCTITSTDFSIKASPIAFDILSSKLYSDPILAIVRELTSNAWDSHINAGTTDIPIDIHLPNIDELWFSIRDYGTGLSHSDIIELYTTFFSSSKNTSNDFTGCFGLGSKTPFAYTDSFTVEDWYNGRHTTYLCNKTNGLPAIFELSSNDSDEHSGILVKIPVEQTSTNQFISACVKYFLFMYDIKVKFNTEHIQFKKKYDIIHEFNYDNVNIKIYNVDDMTLSNYINSNRYTRGGFFIKQGSNVYPLEEDKYNICSTIRWDPNSKSNYLQYANNFAFVITVPIGTYEITPSREYIMEKHTSEITKKCVNLFITCIEDIVKKIADRTVANEGICKDGYYSAKLLTDTINADIAKDIQIIDDQNNIVDMKVKLLEPTIFSNGLVVDSDNEIVYQELSIALTYARASRYIDFSKSNCLTNYSTEFSLFNRKENLIVISAYPQGSTKRHNAIYKYRKILKDDWFRPIAKEKNISYINASAIYYGVGKDDDTNPFTVYRALLNDLKYIATLLKDKYNLEFNYKVMFIEKFLEKYKPPKKKRDTSNNSKLLGGFRVCKISLSYYHYNKDTLCNISKLCNNWYAGEFKEINTVASNAELLNLYHIGNTFVLDPEEITIEDLETSDYNRLIEFIIGLKSYDINKDNSNTMPILYEYLQDKCRETNRVKNFNFIIPVKKSNYKRILTLGYTPLSIRDMVCHVFNSIKGKIFPYYYHNNKSYPDIAKLLLKLPIFIENVKYINNRKSIKPALKDYINKLYLTKTASILSKKYNNGNYYDTSIPYDRFIEFMTKIIQFANEKLLCGLDMDKYVATEKEVETLCRLISNKEVLNVLYFLGNDPKKPGYFDHPIEQYTNKYLTHFMQLHCGKRI